MAPHTKTEQSPSTERADAEAHQAMIKINEGMK
jgi:hypothetical protein